MNPFLAWLADVMLGPRCPVCGDRARGHRTLAVHVRYFHPTWEESA